MARLGSGYWWSGAVQALFPPERGRLHIEHINGHDRFVNEYGELLDWRGYSWFLGHLRHSRGENITTDIKWFKKMGINIVRLFGPLPWEELAGSYSYENFNFQAMDSFLSLLGANGIRCNWSVAPGLPSPKLKAYLNQFYEVASAHWNILVERVNEPHVGLKPDPIRDWVGVNTRNLLEAYGYYPSDQHGIGYQDAPVKDWASIHIPRDSGWARKARHAQEWQHHTRKATVSDEPAKIAEPGFVGAGVKNDWATTPQEAAWHFGICKLWTPGGTIHTQYGRNGQVPPEGSLTHVSVESVRDNVWKKMPTHVQLGDYTGAHFNTSPVDNPSTPSGGPIWTYSSMHGGEAWSVRAYPSAPQAINGWRVVERWGPSGSFVKLVR